jgi:hypothetical protein
MSDAFRRPPDKHPGGLTSRFFASCPQVIDLRAGRSGFSSRMMTSCKSKPFAWCSGKFFKFFRNMYMN